MCRVADVKEEGQVMVMGLKDEDLHTRDMIQVARAFIGARCHDLKTWLNCPTTSKPFIPELRGQCQDIILNFVPNEYRRVGPSCGLGVFLALIQLYFPDHARLRPNVASTGYLNITGGTEAVADIAAKVRKPISASCTTEEANSHQCSCHCLVLKSPSNDGINLLWVLLGPLSWYLLTWLEGSGGYQVWGGDGAGAQLQH